MFRFSKRHYGFVILIGALIYKGIRLGDFCYDLVDSFVIGGIGLVFFMAMLIVTFYNLYHISLKKEFYDYVPLVFLVVFSALFYIAMYNPSVDIYKTKTAEYYRINSIEGPFKLSLFEDETFVVEEKKNKITCFSKGNYTKVGDSILLNFNQENSLSKGYVVDARNNFLIASDTLQLKP